MHRTRTPMQLWFWPAYLMTTHHPGISAVQLQRRLGIGRYETAWLMLHKLRRAMVAPECSQLQGSVEADEFYVGGYEKGRRARQNHDPNKSIVAIAVELRGRGSGRLRLAVVPDVSADSLCGFLTDVVQPGATIHTDAWQSYKRLSRPAPRWSALSPSALTANGNAGALAATTRPTDRPTTPEAGPSRKVGLRRRRGGRSLWRQPVREDGLARGRGRQRS